MYELRYLFLNRTDHDYGRVGVMQGLKVRLGVE